jgi:UrcA family protein
MALSGATAHAQSRSSFEVVGVRPDSDQLERRVPYGDLNLAAAPGQSTLTLRVRSAVSDVCSPYDGTNMRTRMQECRSFAWHGAQPQMARAIQRAQQLAATGSSSIPEVAISVVAPSDL